MILVDRVRKIIDCVLLTELITNGSPVSAALLAGSDAGKSQLVLERIPETARIINDFHYATLIPLLNSKEPPTRIIIPDFNMVLAHRPSVATLTCAMLLGLMGEGLDDIPGFTEESHKLAIKELRERGIFLSILTAMTPDMFRSKRGKWRGTGFLRRMLPIYFAYSPATVKKIQHYISDGHAKTEYPKTRFKLQEKRSIKISSSMLKDIERLAEFARQEQLVWFWRDNRAGTKIPIHAIDYPFTIQKTYITMAKAHALNRHNGQVDAKDMDFLEDMHRFVRYDTPELI